LLTEASYHLAIASPMPATKVRCGAVRIFGTFVAKTRGAREGRNPATGETIQIKEKTSAAFRPASALKDL
ncbi:MAG: HU family DNA-binding protein, partial [Pseudomonadota bacterium]